MFTQVTIYEFSKMGPNSWTYKALKSKTHNILFIAENYYKPKTKKTLNFIRI